MAFHEAVSSSLQQASSSSAISARPLQAAFKQGRRPCRRPCSPLHTSAISGREDEGAPALHRDRADHGAPTLRRDGDRPSSGGGRPSLFKSVQEGLAPHAVIQQVSSLGHFFVPDIPSALVKEIKKRIPLISFREIDDEDDGEAAEMANGLSNSLLEDEPEAQPAAMGPRCAWPRVKLTSIQIARPQPSEYSMAQGPRCAWPRGSPSLQNLALNKKEDSLQRSKSETANGAKCAWPKVAGKIKASQEINSSISIINQIAQEGANNVNFKSGDGIKSLSGGMENMKDIPKRFDSGKSLSGSQLIEGPRCAWPRATPRRTLATGVGLGLMNYLFASQGAPALAILVQSPLPFPWEDDSDTNHKSLLP